MIKFVFLLSLTLLMAPHLSSAALLCKDLMKSDASKTKNSRQIKLPSGQIFTLKELLGQGKLTFIYDIGDGWALRVPKNSKSVFIQNEYLDSMHEFYDMQKELKEEGLSVIEVDRKRSEPPFGIVVKKENFLFNAKEFLEALRDPKKSKISIEVLEKAKEKFLEFMDKTWRFQEIGDMRPDNIGYNGDEWILFDFRYFSDLPNHLPLMNFQQTKVPLETRDLQLPDQPQTVTLQFLTPELERDIKKRILNIRKIKQAEFQTWYERDQMTTQTPYNIIDRVTPSPIPECWNKKISIDSAWSQNQFEGQLPNKKNLKIKFLHALSLEGPIHKYAVLVNEKGPGTLYLNVKETKNSWKNFDQLKKESETEGKDYILGPDFFIRFE